MKVLETRTGDLQRQLLIAQFDLKAVREDAHLQDVAKAQLEAQLAGDCPAQLHLIDALASRVSAVVLLCQCRHNYAMHLNSCLSAVAVLLLQ